MRRCSSGSCSQGSPGERFSVEGWSSGCCVGHGLHGSGAWMWSGLGELSGALLPQRKVSGSLGPDQHVARLDLFCSVWRFLIPSFTSIFKTPQATWLIPLSSLASYCVNGIKNSEPMPEEGWGGDMCQCDTVSLNSIRSPRYCSILNKQLFRGFLSSKHLYTQWWHSDTL